MQKILTESCIYFMNGKSHPLRTLKSPSEIRRAASICPEVIQDRLTVCLCVPAGEVPHSGSLQIRGLK